MVDILPKDLWNIVVSYNNLPQLVYKDEILETLIDYLPKDIIYRIIRQYTYKNLPLSLQYDIKNYIKKWSQDRLRAYVSTYNILRIISGMHGLAYSN